MSDLFFTELTESLVDNLIFMHKEKLKARSKAEFRAAQRAIQKLNKEIDNLKYVFYGVQQ